MKGGFVMKKFLKFKPQEFAAVVVDTITSACLVANGVPSEQATFIGASLGSVIKGIDLSDNGLSGTILSSVEKSIKAVLDSNSFEISDVCRGMLKSDVLSPKKIIKFMFRADAYVALRKQIIQICKQDTDCDIETFPIDEFVIELTKSFEEEVLNNHEFATYAIYCMLRKDTPFSDIHLANKQYVNSFVEPLFLHKNINGTCVNLKKLFVLQKCLVLSNGYNEEQENSEILKKDLQMVISDYLHDKATPFLFIEGDAGSGKSTLVAWMNYHYSMVDEVAEQLFGERPLLTIRLRDLDKNEISRNKSLSSAIRKYMNLSTLDDLEKFFPNAVMILDGFDELCMIEGMDIEYENLLYDLYHKELEGFQFIVTTRPKFISGKIYFPSKYISLQHFDAEQRDIWLEHYTSDKYCAQTIDEKVYTYIKSIDDNTASCICDTPMTLYMLAAKKSASDFLENNWALYHHIFFEELSETEYNKMFPDPDRKYSHDICVLRDVLYQVSEEIAYMMYRNGNKIFHLSDEELTSIIENLSKQNPILKHANMQDIAERCYALCCYWKANSNRGAVEFLHNNIRDFFLAEKIYREMDELTREIMLDSDLDSYIKVANKLCLLFQYGILETKVIEFILLRAEWKAMNKEVDFAQYEYLNNLVAKIIDYISHDGIVDSDVLSEKKLMNPLQTITNILTCTVQLYRHIYQAYLKKGETIMWIYESDSNAPIRNNMLLTMFKYVFCQVPVTLSNDDMLTLASRGYFSDLDFKNFDLRNIGFQGSIMENCDFSGAILSGCDFTNVTLNNSDLSNADIHYASLKDATLTNCNMTGADLRGTDLPDGYVSINQDEQIEHLKSLHITGLII